MTDTCRAYTIPAESRTYTVETMTGGTILVTTGTPGYWGTSYWGTSYWGGLYWTAGSVSVTASPTERRLTIEAENRTYTIDDDGTGNSIDAGNAGSPMGLLLLFTYTGAVTVTGTPTGRTLVVEAEDRTYTIEC